MFASLNLHALKVMTKCIHDIMTSFTSFLFSISIFVQQTLTGRKKKKQKKTFTYLCAVEKSESVSKGTMLLSNMVIIQYWPNSEDNMKLKFQR